MVEEAPNLIEYLPAALRALRISVEDLLETFWDDACRRRVSEQATALASASKLQGLVRVFTLARAAASICFITRQEALPIRREIADKLRELLDLLDAAADDSLGEQTG
jgi:hypothetical protein